MHMIRNNTQISCGIENCLKELNMCQEDFLHTITPPARTVETRLVGSMDSYC